MRIKKILEITIPGDPVPKGRPKASRQGNFIRMRTPKRTRDEGERLRFHVLQHLKKIDSSIFPSEKPLVGFFEFYIRRPKNLHRRKDPEGIILHTKKPDGSNFLKLIEDVLEGLIYKNDSQFFMPISMKFYTSKTGVPHQKIRIYEITD